MSLMNEYKNLQSKHERALEELDHLHAAVDELDAELAALRLQLQASESARERVDKMLVEGEKNLVRLALEVEKGIQSSQLHDVVNDCLASAQHMRAALAPAEGEG